ncbi:cobalamin biosynthesis protein [Alicyclobacillus curvatus]|nr:cobalamin biosynthesis protein [Alicyclobacillus curvatus]
MSKPYAVVAITKHGVEIARRLQAGLAGTDVYYPAKFARGDETARGIYAYDGSVTQFVPELFVRYDGLIGIFSLGAMVRLVAPLLKDKKTDPAVVVIDDQAQHVISVLSGHLGGANQLTQQVARCLGAEPVITTASDVSETLAVDLLGREFGWEIENFEKVTAVSAAVVNEQKVHIVQEAGERNWWPYSKPLPPWFCVYSSTQAAMHDPFDAALVITPRLLTLPEQEHFLTNGVLYRPKVIVLGVGCNRGTKADEIESVVLKTLQDLRLSERSVRNLATIDIKKDEPGLLEVCEGRAWPLVTYTAAELNRVPLAHPSETVYRYVGAWGVCEPAARLSSGAKDWVLEKVKSGNVTVSVCMVTADA